MEKEWLVIVPYGDEEWASEIAARHLASQLKTVGLVPDVLYTTFPKGDR